MRKRLNLLVLSVTGLVVVAFVVPLGLLVRRQADQRARLAAEREVQTVVALVAREVSAGRPVSSAAVTALVGSFPPGVSVVLPDGEVVGDPPPNPELVSLAGVGRRAQSAYTERGWELAVPVLTPDQVVIVYAVVPEEELTRGVAQAWMLLAGLGVLLMGASLFLADRLGRTLVGPSRRLALAAHRLGEGELDTRVEVESPPEMAEIARAFNRLATQLRHLLAAEREAVADLSHRLRTPLTAVRLEAERVSDPDQRAGLLHQVDRLHQAVDELIAEARRRPEEGPAVSDLAGVVRDRTAFWRVLAEEQGREMTVEVPEVSVPVKVGKDELAAAVDALIENVFAHTEAGTRFWVEVRSDPPALAVSDDGPGFPEGFDASARGVSGGGSTGLGLDIARRLAERCGGELRIGSRVGGGARVEVMFGWGVGSGWR